MGGVLENVIPLSKLIGLLFLFCLPLPSISFLKTKRNDLARPVMGTIFLVRFLVYNFFRTHAHTYMDTKLITLPCSFARSSNEMKVRVSVSQ